MPRSDFSSESAADWKATEWLTAFVAEFVSRRPARSVLDSFGEFGISNAIHQRTPKTRVDVLFQRPGVTQFVAEQFGRSDSVHFWTHGDAITGTQQDYDIVLSFGPVGMMPQTGLAPLGGTLSGVRDLAAQALIEASARLAHDGTLLTIVIPDFYTSTKKANVREYLRSAGLFISASLRLRPGSFAATMLPLDLVILEHTPRTEMFVAEIPEDNESQMRLIDRMLAREQGETVAQGRLVPPAEYRGLEAYEAFEAIAKLGERRGLIAMPFSDVVKDFRRPTRKPDLFVRPDDDENAVYLPEMAKTPATTSQAQLPDRLKSYLQLIIYPEVAIPEYFARWLNSPIGHALRNASMSGITMPRIQASALQNMTIYLPPIREQRLALESLGKISGLKAELNELEAKIWDQPRQSNQVLEALNAVNHEERFEDWVETLPFPLASILRAYRTVDSSNKDKYERLLHFFEALAAYSATILLSGAQSMPGIWESARLAIASSLGEQGLNPSRPTFGLWRTILAAIAPALRHPLNSGASEKQTCLDAFCSLDSRPIEALCSRELLDVLDQANMRRNRWTGHGGIPSQAVATDRLNEMHDLLEAFRQRFGRVFLQYELLQLGSATILPGPVYRYEARRVMGSNPMLEHTTVDVVDPASSGEMCCFGGQTRVLLLAPLFQLRDVPQPACYFFNRMERERAHFVSYHLVDVPDIEDLEHSPMIVSMMSQLERTSGGGDANV